MFFGNISPISLIYYQYYVIDTNKKIRMIPAPVLLITAACLLYSGQAMYPLTLTESEYNGALAEFLKKGTEKVIYENLRLNKLMADSQNDCQT